LQQFKESKTPKKDWEIVAVRDKDGKLFYTDMVPTNGQKIEALKRLSDGEVFSVGDKDVWFGEIKSFKLLGYSIFAYFNFNISKEIRFLEKPKPTPLFTTEDEVGVF
jgi:hypothetical protein